MSHPRLLAMEQVPVQGRDLGVTGVVLTPLDAQNGVVGDAAFFRDSHQVTLAVVQLLHHGF